MHREPRTETSEEVQIPVLGFHGEGKMETEITKKNRNGRFLF